MFLQPFKISKIGYAEAML